MRIIELLEDQLSRIDQIKHYIATNAYPEFLSDGDVQLLILEIHKQIPFDEIENQDDGDFWDRLKYDRYQLVNFPIDKLKDVDISDWDDLYSSVRTSAPPIILETKSGYILDGFHRAVAAIIRGDKTIRAYIPSE